MHIGTVILAAGAGTRMGGVAKALLRRGDRTFLQCIVETARVGHVVVVVGPPFGNDVAAHAREFGAQVVVNDDPSRGMASSVELGFAAIAARKTSNIDMAPGIHMVPADEGVTLDAAWLWPVDHPDVQRATLDALRYALESTRADVAQPRYRGRGGHPPLIAAKMFARFATCANLPEGARTVIAHANVIAVDVDDDAGTVEDVDR